MKKSLTKQQKFSLKVFDTVNKLERGNIANFFQMDYHWNRTDNIHIYRGPKIKGSDLSTN